MPDAQAGRRQVERHRLAGDQVVGGERRELRVQPSALEPRLRRVDLDAYVLAHHARLAAARGAARAGAGSAAPRPTSWSTSTSRSPPTCPWCARRRRTRPWSRTCRSLLAKARNKAVGTRVSTWRGVRVVLHRALPGGALPAALVVARLPGRQRRGDRGDDAVAARPPERRAEPALARARSTSWSTTTSRTTTATYAASHFAAAGVDQQRLGLGAVHRVRDPRAAGDLPALQQHRQPGDDRLDHAPARPRPGVLGADPPARPARADRGLRGRRRRAAAVLVVDRARRAAPAPSPSPARGGRRAPSRSGWSAVLW